MFTLVDIKVENTLFLKKTFDRQKNDGLNGFACQMPNIKRENIFIPLYFMLS
jgi:hypothetical protein